MGRRHAGSEGGIVSKTVPTEAEQAEQRAAEETAIVDKIWDLFGRPSYKDLNGRSIYDLITDVQQRAADLENVLNHLHDDPKRAQAYFWNHQGRKQRMEAIRADMEALNGGGK